MESQRKYLFFVCMLVLLLGCSRDDSAPSYLRAKEIQYFMTYEDFKIEAVRTHPFEATLTHTLAPLGKTVWLKVPIPSEVKSWREGAVLYTGANEATYSMSGFLASGNDIKALEFCNIKSDSASCALPTLQYAFAAENSAWTEHNYLYLKISPGYVGVQNDFYFMQNGYFSRITALLIFILGTSAGVIIFTVILAFVFYASLKEKAFLAYGLLYTDLILATLVVRGMWDLLRPPDWIAGANFVLSLQVLVAFFDLWFLKTFFEIPQKDPRINRAVNFYMGICLTLAVLAFLPGYYSFAWQSFPYYISTTLVVETMLLSYLIYKKRDWAPSVGGAWFLAIFITIAWNLYRQGDIEGTWIFGLFGVIGRVVQGLLLNVVLYQKLKSLVKQIFEGRSKMEEGRIIKTLLRTLSHDLSHTTQLIGLNARISVETNNLSPSMQKNLEEILEATKAQTDIINHAKHKYLLRGSNVLDMEKVELVNCIDIAATLYHHSCEIKNVQLNVQTEKNEMNALADKTSLTYQVLANVIHNAVKFTPSGKSVTISVKYLDADWVEVVVADEGIGMSKEIIDQLFSEGPISRPGTAQEESTGHGLLIVSDFMKAFGGKISIESEIGKGTKVFLQLKRYSGLKNHTSEKLSGVK